MARHKEPLNQGLWTAPDPGVLEPGQLADARNCFYLAGSQALVRAPGRVAFGTVTASAVAVAGLRDIQFDNGDHYLIAMSNGKYRSSPVADSGSFTDVAALTTTATTLESAHFRNRFFMFNGATADATAITTNQVIYLSATSAGSALQVRQHGMLPVINAPTSATATGTFSQTVTGYYEYWTTEVAKLTADGAALILESTYDASPTTIFVSSTGQVPVIGMPPLRNQSLVTHWRVYRSPKKDSASAREFPSGFQIAEVVTASATVNDTLTVTTGSYAFPTTYNGGSDIFQSAGAQATALGADDGVYASISGTASPTYQGCYGFNFGGFNGNIRGIELEFQAFMASGSGTCPISVGVGRRVSNHVGEFEKVLNDLGHLVPRAAYRSVNLTATASPGQTLTVGSSTDVWSPIDGPQFTDGDFTSGSWMVTIGFQRLATIVNFDYVKCRVYYGATVDSTTPFPTVVYTFGDVTSQVGKNGPAPCSTTGDLFEDSLVVNDASNLGIIRYSYPGLPESFPSTYFLDFETPNNDRVQAIRVVNDQLLVWLDNATYRINYLPSERDASFDRGKARKAISSTYGCISPMCVTVFSPAGGIDLAAFVSDHGIHATDGFNFQTYTSNLNWRRIMDLTSVPVALINDRERRLLLFYFRNDVAYGSETFMCLPLSYGEGHWINDQPKVCGLIHMRNNVGGQFGSLESAWCVERGTGAVSTYLGYGGATAAGAGQVFIESGSAMPALDPRFQFTTRRMYLAEPGNEWMMGELYGYAFGYDAQAPTANYTIITNKTNDTGPTTLGSKNITLGGQVLHKAGTFRQMTEGLTVSMVATASAYSQEFLIVDGTGFGLEDSGR